MTDGLLVQDEAGQVIYMNDRACEILGYTRDEIVGRPVTYFLDPAGIKVYQEQMVRRKGGFEADCEGKTSREIGDLLFISFRTVNRHRSSIMQKPHIKNSTDLVKYAIENGYV